MLEPFRARPEARAHGGPVDARLRALGLDRDQILDFSVNINPYGPAPAMLAALREVRVDLYPDPTGYDARVALARVCGVAPERIVLGNGGADLLWTLARLLVAPGQAVAMVEPTFSEFRAAAVAAGARVVEWRAHAERAFAIDPAAVVAAAHAADATALYLCTPNNPTGVSLDASAIRSLAVALPRVTIVLDQAFVSLSEHHADGAVDLPDNVIRVRSLTKEHAIPGVRIGYLIASPSLASAIEAVRPAWTSSAFAQCAAIAACELSSFVDASRERLLADRRALAAGLRGLDLTPEPSSATFLLVPVGDAAPLCQALLARHRILVRDCASFGLPGHIRLGARPAAERARLLAAMEAEISALKRDGRRSE